MTPAQLARRMLPPLAAVGSVTAVILLLLVLNSQPTPAGPGPGAVAQLPASSTRTAPVPTVSLPVQEPPATTPPSAPTHAAGPAVVRPAVTVLNNSRESGLAHRVATQLRAAGWTIRQTGNFRGRIRATTAYYPPGGYSAATALARRFPQIRRVLPRFAGLPGSGLTLVLTRDWS